MIHVDGMLFVLFLWFSTDWKIGLYCGIGVYCGLFECCVGQIVWALDVLAVYIDGSGGNELIFCFTSRSLSDRILQHSNEACLSKWR